MTITHEHFPTQLPIFGQPCVVSLDGDLVMLLTGDIVRADAEDPNVTIIMLEDGRFLLGSECTFTPITEVGTAMTADKVEPTQSALEARIAEEIEAMDEATCTKAAVTELAKGLLGDDWAFRVHAAHGRRPLVFVGKYLGELAAA